MERAGDGNCCIHAEIRVRSHRGKLGSNDRIIPSPLTLFSWSQSAKIDRERDGPSSPYIHPRTYTICAWAAIYDNIKDKKVGF